MLSIHIGFKAQNAHISLLSHVKHHFDRRMGTTSCIVTLQSPCSRLESLLLNELILRIEYPPVQKKKKFLLVGFHTTHPDLLNFSETSPSTSLNAELAPEPIQSLLTILFIVIYQESHISHDVPCSPR